MKANFFELVSSGISINKAAILCGIGRTNGKKIYKKWMKEIEKDMIVELEPQTIKENFTVRNAAPISNINGVSEVSSDFWNSPAPYFYINSVPLLLPIYPWSQSQNYVFSQRI